MRARAVALVLVVSVLAAPPLGATCTCTVSAAAAEPRVQVSGRSAGACSRLTRIGLGIDGGTDLGIVECYGTSCSYTATGSTACLRTGVHTANAGCWCGQLTNKGCVDDTATTFTTFSVNTTPTVGVSYSGPDLEGKGTLSIPFSYPNTTNSNHRYMAASVDGVRIFELYLLDVSGTYTKPWSTTCWSQGSHQIKASVVACSQRGDPDYQGEATTTVQVNHQPGVSVSLAPLDPTQPEGTQVARVSYSFPQTAHSSDRAVTLRTFPSGVNLGTIAPAERDGVWFKNVSCSAGGNAWVQATATACGETQAVAVAALPGCPRPPRKTGCVKKEASCTLCFDPGGGVGADGGGPGFGSKSGPPALGPGAKLSYLAGGAGSPGNPGQAAWNTILGRNWSHDYAERIVPATGGRAWLITESATFREYTDADNDGLYEKVSPEDEYRTLTKTATGWTLRDLDGSVTSFDAGGLWQSTTDRNGNAKTATYTAGRLTGVAMPDGRSETFAYHPSGKLASITEIGVDGVTQRTWTYTWSGNDLVSVEAPDGTGQRFEYGDSRHPGYMTRRLLVGKDDGDPATPRPERVESAWEYDAAGNVVRTWSGSPDFATGVERYEVSYDNPIEPTRTTVTIHRGATEREVVTYTLSRTATGVGAKARVTSISGDCSSCGLGPNSQLFYDDPANPLLPTRIVDGRGTETLLSYDAHGRMVTKTEAAGTPLSRTTAWTYDSTFPALPTRIETPSTAGGASRRTTLLTYDTAGNLTSRRVQGVEAGGFFDLETVTAFNAAGQPLSIDPPGYGSSDATGFTYDPTRGNLIADSRIDPLVGATTYEHDPFNRQTAVIDPNGVRTETTYDGLNRILTVAHEDLITTHEYNAFGDLTRTTLPRGNVIEYGYDPAGRMISMERKLAPTTLGERTLYTLDQTGHRVKEELQSWDGAAWATQSWTEYQYLNRCQVGKVVHAGGATTEYAYDCDGNLEKVWDANHPKATNPTPTQLYTYDELDRLSSVTQPWTGAGGTTAVTSYSYDVQDHLTAVTDAEGNTTNYIYSDRDLMTQEVSPVSGTRAHAYNEHGERVSETDARGITTARTVDALDRVTLIDSPDDALDTSYTYDDPAVPFSKGRLTRIARSGSEIAYAYDRFGRVVQDGELAYLYDENGNRSEIGYPGGVTARFTHDFADREASLEVQAGSAAPQTLVSGATYKPFGPLAALHLGNGLVETRGFNGQYFPASIEMPGRLLQTYATDPVGNILGIARTVGTQSYSMVFSYQDPQYFLTQGNGPWGQQSWTYDRIGNRLSEVSSSERFLYSYQGHNPKLLGIQPAPGGEPGSRLDFGYDAAGNQTSATVTSSEGSGRTSFLSYSAESRLDRISTSDSLDSTHLLYDGRGFLRHSRLGSRLPVNFEQTEPVYSSEGLLLARRYYKQYPRGGPRDDGFPANITIKETVYVFSFAGRPMAQLTRQELGGTDRLLYLTTDHLGTPIQATDTARAIVWQGGLDPFGAPFVFPRQGPPEGGDQDNPVPGVATSTTATMEGAGIFLRFPGQWDDSFRSNELRGGLYYNVHRYYMPGTGRYTSPDPLGLRSGTHLYDYVFNNPLGYSDPLGLRPAEACGITWVGFLGAIGDINNQVIFCAPCKCGPPKINGVTYGDQPPPPPGVEPPAGVAPVPSTPSLPFSTYDRCKCTGPEKIYVNVQTRRSLSILQFLYSARKVHLDYDCPRDGR
jgi:RHS repeat-associated protein